MENKNVEVVFDAESGALLRMTDKHSGWEIMKREVLGQSFELLLPMEGSEMTDADRRFNVVKGIKQANPAIEKAGNQSHLYLERHEVRVHGSRSRISPQGCRSV